MHEEIKEVSKKREEFIKSLVASAPTPQKEEQEEQQQEEKQVQQEIPIEKSKSKTIFQIDPVNQIQDLPDFKNKEEMNVRYPLISPYSYVHIHWDNKLQEVIYEVVEPELDKKEKQILKTLEEGIKELINISFISVKKGESVIEYLEKNINVLLKELGFTLSEDTFKKVMYYIYRDFVGLNKIEPLLCDYFIEDIECNGLDSLVYIVHRKYRNLKTNIKFSEITSLASFVERLAQKCGKYVSYASPMLDGSLSDGSRVNATYTTDISSKGPTFTIRKFTKDPWSPTKMIQLGTVSPEILAYLWILVEHEFNVMVIGGTGSGKTTLLNCLAFFIPQQARVVSIEDTREINIEHENWLPSVAREGVGLSNLIGQKYGEVTLFDLLKESFRQRPDYVIIGEVRGKEAYVLFQGMASIDGNEKILLLNSNHPKRIKIKDLKNDIKYKAITLDPFNKESGIFKVKNKIIHPKRNLLYKIITKKGREVVLTPNHSLFTYDNGIIPILTEKLKVNDKIIIPARLPCNYANEDYLNLIKYFPDMMVFAPHYIKEAVKKLGYYNSSKLCDIKSITDFYSNFKRNKPFVMKFNKFSKLMENAKIKYDLDKIKVRFDRKSKIEFPKFKITDEFLRLLGYFISEGSLNLSKSNRISLYSKNTKILEDMENCIIKVTKTIPKKRITKGYDTSQELSFNHKIIFEFLKRYCGTNSKNKKIPDFIFGLSKHRIGQFLSALYDGDGCFSKNYFGYYTISRDLANDITQLLLVFNIVATIKKRNRGKNADYEILFYKGYERKKFLEYTKPIKIKKLEIKEFEKNKDYFIDKIKEIRKINLKKPRNVYDISVPGPQSFIGGFGGILLHNSGHPSMGTMHANDVDTMIRRLETPPIDLSPSLVESMDAVCTMVQSKIKGGEVRRLKTIAEIISVPEGVSKAEVNTPFIWDPKTDVFYFKTDSHIFKELTTHYGFTYEKLVEEFNNRTKLLYTLYKRQIFDFKDVQNTINEYIRSPKKVLKQYGIIK